eukprot:1295536-Pleurochrysis_carterae.AAC.1
MQHWSSKSCSRVVGSVSAEGLYVAFDYVDLRFCSIQDVRELRELKLLLAWNGNGGIVKNERLADRAEGVTVLKEGREKEKVVGTLVGLHEKTLGGERVYLGHYVHTDAFGDCDERT